MQKITPFLWFDNQAEEAANFYVEAFTSVERPAEVGNILRYDEAEQCGWLQDKYGVSWQIVPRVLPEMLGDKDLKKAGRAMQAMLQMKKIDIKTLQEAHEG